MLAALRANSAFLLVALSSSCGGAGAAVKPAPVSVASHLPAPAGVTPARSRSAWLTAETLKSQRRVTLGKLAQTTVHVCYDAIQDSDYAEHLRGRTNALLVTQFVTPDRGSTDPPNELGDAVIRKLATSAAGATSFSRALEVTLDGPKFVAHTIAPEVAERTGFPMQLVYVLVFERGSDAAAKGARITSAFEGVLVHAARNRIENVIVPAITVSFADENRIPFDALYEVVLNEIAASGYPGNVHLDMYRNWSDEELEGALAALRERWDALAAR